MTQHNDTPFSRSRDGRLWRVLMERASKQLPLRVALVEDYDTARQIARELNLTWLSHDVQSGRRPQRLPLAYVVPDNEA